MNFMYETMKHERFRRFLRRWTMDAQVQVMGGGGGGLQISWKLSRPMRKFQF